MQQRTEPERSVGLRNKRGGGRVGHSAHLLPRKFSGQMKMPQDETGRGSGEASVPCLSQALRAEVARVLRAPPLTDLSDGLESLLPNAR